MIASIVLLSLLLGRAAAVECDGIPFFGEDRNPDDGQNDVLPLNATPNANATRELFFMGITNPTTEDFETFSAGDTSLSLIFPNTTITADLSGGEIREDPPPINGQYAISPKNYFSTDSGTFVLKFSQNVSAFGFFGVDVGDVQGVLSFVAVREDGSTCTVDIPHEVDGPSGGVLYFGFIDVETPFREVRFTNSRPQGDRFAFDDFTIAGPLRVVATFAPTGSPTPNELCVEGITNSDETVCCDGDCISCGGCDCDLDPLGAALCCPGVIAGSGFECMVASDVACLLGDYIPSEDSECIV